MGSREPLRATITNTKSSWAQLQFLRKEQTTRSICIQSGLQSSSHSRSHGELPYSRHAGPGTEPTTPWLVNDPLYLPGSGWGGNNKARANQIPKGVSELSSCSVTENTPFSMDMIFEYSSCSFAPTEPDETNSQQTVADASGRPSWSASITCFSSVKTQRRAQQQHCKSSISLAFIDFVCCS